MRSLLIVIFLLIFFLIGIPINFVLWIISKSNPERASRAAQWCVRYAVRFILFLAGTKLDIRGLEKLDSTQPYLYVGNHRSYFDVVIGYAYVPGLTGFVSKMEMKRIPLLNWWMYFVNCLFLDRDDIKQGLKTILAAIDKVKNGISIFIFPEGTRVRDGEQIPFHDGSFKIAQKGHCPVVPVTFVNTSSIYEDHIPWVRSAKVIVEFGDPVLLTELSDEDRKRPGVYFGKFLEDNIARLEKEL